MFYYFSGSNVYLNNDGAETLYYSNCIAHDWRYGFWLDTNGLLHRGNKTYSFPTNCIAVMCNGNSWFQILDKTGVMYFSQYFDYNPPEQQDYFTQYPTGLSFLTMTRPYHGSWVVDKNHNLFLRDYQQLFFCYPGVKYAYCPMATDNCYFITDANQLYFVSTSEPHTPSSFQFTFIASNVKSCYGRSPSYKSFSYLDTSGNVFFLSPNSGLFYKVWENTAIEIWDTKLLTTDLKIFEFGSYFTNERVYQIQTLRTPTSIQHFLESLPAITIYTKTPRFNYLPPRIDSGIILDVSNFDSEHVLSDVTFPRTVTKLDAVSMGIIQDSQIENYKDLKVRATGILTGDQFVATSLEILGPAVYNSTDPRILHSMDCYDLSGSRAKSRIGSDATYYNCTVNQPGKYLNAVTLSADTGKILIPHSADFNFCDSSGDLPFSFSFWIKINSIPVTGFVNLFRKSDAILGACYQAYISCDSGSCKFAVKLFGDSTGTYIGRISSSSLLLTGYWFFLTITYDGSAASTGIKIYINGAESPTKDDSLGTYVMMQQTTDPLSVGALHPEDTNAPDASISSFEVRNYALTSKNILELIANLSILQSNKLKTDYILPYNTLMGLLGMRQGAYALGALKVYESIVTYMNSEL